MALYRLYVMIGGICDQESRHEFVRALECLNSWQVRKFLGWESFEIVILVDHTDM